MMMMKKSSILLALFSLLWWASATTSSISRPDESDAPRFARWLVSEGSWGVLATIDEEGFPFGNIASYSDAGTGSPYFYLSKLDPTPCYADTNPLVSFTLSEIEFGGCNGIDPQSPKCAQINLTGLLNLLVVNSSEAVAAEAALFADHPQFRGFPKMNGTFFVYKLVIEEITIENEAVAPAEVNPEEYFKITL